MLLLYFKHSHVAPCKVWWFYSSTPDPGSRHHSTLRFRWEYHLSTSSTSKYFYQSCLVSTEDFNVKSDSKLINVPSSIHANNKWDNRWQSIIHISSLQCHHDCMTPVCHSSLSSIMSSVSCLQQWFTLSSLSYTDQSSLGADTVNMTHHHHHLLTNHQHVVTHKSDYRLIFNSWIVNHPQNKLLNWLEKF